MNPTSPAATVLDEVATWAGITTQPTPRGATAIVFEGHELGHVHANRSTLDLSLPADRRAQVLEAGRAKKWFSDWVSKRLASRADAEDGIALLRESYDALHAPLGVLGKGHMTILRRQRQRRDSPRSRGAARMLRLTPEKQPPAGVELAKAR
jgi:hypothetical protein